MTITVNDLKDYLRINFNNDDAVLSVLLETAKSLAYEKTGISYTSGDLLYEQLLKFLVQHLYDNRTAFADRQAVEVPYTITELVKTITYRGEIVTEQTSESDVTGETNTTSETDITGVTGE